MSAIEHRLPASLLARASLRGGEYAWSPADIPEVVESARRAGLVNVGGQLQFRVPDGPTAECYWVEVDTYKLVPPSVSSSERVERAAAEALKAFNDLPSRYDFLAEGRRNFPDLIRKAEDAGRPADEAVCFVWYLADPDEEKVG